METHFSAFKKRQDVGCYGWNPRGGRRLGVKQLQEVDILNCLKLDAQPPRLLDGLDRLARANPSFTPLMDLKVPNSHPYCAQEITPLVVAKSRGVNVDQVEFLCGGSTLNVLATREVPQGDQYRFGDSSTATKYLMQRVGNTVVISKSAPYENNLADKGFQFERLVTTGSRAHDNDMTVVEHLSVWDVGGHRVLFSAEVDARDASGRMVEIKAANPMYYKLKVIFQMISSCSQTLVQADSRGPNLLGITTTSLDSEIRRKSQFECETAQRRIVEGFNDIKSAKNQMKEGVVYELDFESNGALKIKTSERSLLPTGSVIGSLLSAASTCLRN